MPGTIRLAILVLALTLGVKASAQESPVATPSPDRYRHLSSTGELPPRSPAILPIRQGMPGSFVVSNRYRALQGHMPPRYNRQVSLGTSLTDGKTRIEMLREVEENLKKTYIVLEERMLSRMENQKERENETDYAPAPATDEPRQHQPLQTLPHFPLRGRFF